MKKTKENNETKALIKKENENVWKKIKNWFKKFNSKMKNSKEIIEEQKKDIKDSDILLEEKNVNNIINKAKQAFENYVINDTFEIEENLYKFIEERIKANEDNIKRIIEINKVNITFDEIIKIVEDEKKILKEYKRTVRTIKIDEIFMFSEYQVPVGVIGIETNHSKDAIINILKALTTRNAIIVIQEEYNKYSIENLILLIVKESLKKFDIDENIIQIVKKEEINNVEKTEFDIFINKEGLEERKDYKEKLYIYQEDEYFKEVIEDELKSLRTIGREVELLTGEFYKCIEIINKSRNLGVSIYTQDRKKGYKFVNLINSKNVFLNSNLQNVQDIEENNIKYLTNKNIICEYKIV